MAQGAQMFVIAVSGMRFEAQLAFGSGVLCIASPVTADLEAQLEKAIASAPAGALLGLVSFGTVGALAPELCCGDWVIARQVDDEAGTRYAADAAWSAALLRCLPQAHCGVLLGVAAPVTSLAGKLALFARTQALAVDMESHVVGRMAARYELPFSVARVVLDGRETAIPAAAMAGLAADGSTRLAPVLAALARAPQDLPGLLRLGRAAMKARAALAQGRRALGWRFAFPTLDGHDEA